MSPKRRLKAVLPPSSIEHEVPQGVKMDNGRTVSLVFVCYFTQPYDKALLCQSK
jgi:hypothetical protein